MKPVRNILISFFCFCAFWVGLVYFQLGNPTQESKWVEEVYSFKEKYASQIHERKIVMVSGSNCLFGIDSEMLEKEWGMPVVNDAVHAGLQMPYILYKSKKVLKQGDIAILPLEYFFYINDYKPSQTYTDFVLARDVEYFSNLPIKEKFKLVFAVSFERIITGIRSPFHKLKPTVGFYGVQNLNSHGDEIVPYDKEAFSKLDTVRADVIPSNQLSDEFRFYMNQYVAWAKKNHIKLIFMPPNHMYFKAYHLPHYKAFLQNIKKYYDEKHLLYIGDPYDYMYKKEYYFNTTYHLNDRGVALRTKQLIHDLKPVMATIINSGAKS